MRKPFDVLAPFPSPVPMPFASPLREMNECTGRQDNAGTVYIAEWTEERDEARVEGKKNVKKDVQLIRKPSQVLAFLPDPFAFILAFVLPPNPYKEDEDEDEHKDEKEEEEEETVSSE